MQPNPPPSGFPQQGQSPIENGPAQWDGGPNPLPPSPKANAAAAMIASILALLTVVMFVWFSLHDVINLDNGLTGGLTSMVLVNVLGGAVGAGVLLVAAGFTFARRIAGAWTLCALCALYVVATIMIAPLAWGVSLSYQLTWIFGFDKSNGVAVGLAMIFCVLTAIMAAIAGSVKSYEPTTSTPS